MKVLGIGVENRLKELEKKLNLGNDFLGKTNYEFEEKVEDFDVIFDLNLDDIGLFTVYPVYENFEGLLIGGAVKQSIIQMESEMEEEEAINFLFAGMNTLPTFIDREIAEITINESQNEEKIRELFSQLGWETIIVDNRVGMVTPRILFMIINEAFLTLQEGTASKRDIDASMKMGTNYPFGPFEWAEKIGLGEVFETLEAMYEDTHDQRFAAAPLLKNTYLR